MRFGLIGNYSEQFTDDTKDGVVYKNGNTFQSAVIGPMVAYDIGHVTLMARYLAPIYTRNTLNATMIHFSAQVKF